MHHKGTKSTKVTKSDSSRIFVPFAPLWFKKLRLHFPTTPVTMAHHKAF
jgi:hypothetical protein